MNRQNARDRTASSNNDQRNTGHNTRYGASSKDGPIDDSLQAPVGSEEGQSFLEGKSLLVPAGEPIITTSMAAHCLHQIAIMKDGIPKTVVHAIKALAAVLEDTDTLAANQTYHDGFQAELDNFTSECLQLIEDARAKVDEKIEEITQATNLLSQTTKDAAHINKGTIIDGMRSHNNTSGESPTYSQMLTRIQPDVDPKLLAKHGIRRRQIMLEGIPKESAIGKMGDRELKEEINKNLGEIEDNRVRVRAVTQQKNGGILLEMDSDFGAGWARTKMNIDKLCAALGENTLVKKRSYNLIALYVPLSATPEKDLFIEEVQEANSLEAGTITAMRWAKPIARRSKTQRFAHIIITVSDANEANRILALGLHIANKKVSVEKCKREPVRCLKCQGWNHYAKECISKEDTCGHCGQKGHRTSQCQNEGTTHCVSCNLDDHTSYDRRCPTFVRKLADRDRIDPENELPFIPTDAPWTWNRTKTYDQRPPSGRQLTPQIQVLTQKGNQKERRHQQKDTAEGSRPLQGQSWNRSTSSRPESSSSPTQAQMPESNRQGIDEEYTWTDETRNGDYDWDQPSSRSKDAGQGNPPPQ